jgi:hypothetical protein
MDDSISWSPRVRQSLLWQLYRSEAAGSLDECLLIEVGSILYHRCLDIILIEDAVQGLVRCPQCISLGRESLILRETYDPEVLLCCPCCAWQMTWGEYHKSFQGKQLNLGGAGPAFRIFVGQWPRTSSAPEKMLLIDRLIHEFHYSLRKQPDLPTRPACVNLIEGNLTNVVAFLDRLSDGVTNPSLVQNFHAWKENHRRNMDDWSSTKVSE